MQRRFGKCDQPGCTTPEGNVIVKTIPSSGDWCYVCNAARLAEDRSTDTRKAKVRAWQSMRTATGEAVMFETIWNTRPHVSFITGKSLGSEARSFFFAHVLHKSTHPEFRLYDRNIVLLTHEQHQAWDQGSRLALRKDPDWDKMFALEVQLKEEYFKQFRTR